MINIDIVKSEDNMPTRLGVMDINKEVIFHKMVFATTLVAPLLFIGEVNPSNPLLYNRKKTLSLRRGSSP